MRWNWPNKPRYKGQGGRRMTVAFRPLVSRGGISHDLTQSRRPRPGLSLTFLFLFDGEHS